MKRKTCTLKTCILLIPLFALAAAQAMSQTAHSPADRDDRQLTETGKAIANGRSMNYVIQHLPPSSFPDLPAPIADLLNRRGCLIPQTYEARRPENVVHAALEHAGSQDWALLCSVKGTVTLMVFFASAPERPMILATAPETERLQIHDPTGILGFNWGIDPASPTRIHEAQTGMERRPPPPDHDALADSVIDQRTVYRFYSKGKWTLVDMPE
jgi:hypothetical protein